MRTLLNRVFTTWTFVRALYLVMGGMAMIQSFSDRLWPGVIIGGYFAAMGLFGFGCAAGQCLGVQDMNPVPDKKYTGKVDYEEIK